MKEIITSRLALPKTLEEMYQSEVKDKTFWKVTVPEETIA